ncbi:MAG TPA: hypothetical protein VG986_05115 [Pseudolabrys sp.]|nr:hypothetical protein [Pseudolabrys sp.]
MMAKLLPMLVAVAPYVLVADDVPKLNYEPSCKAAVTAAALPGRDEESCKRDEETARATLEKVWSQFDGADRKRCLSLTSLGGAPSYVELLTCLEMSRDVKNMPDGSTSGQRIER